MKKSAIQPYFQAATVETGPVFKKIGFQLHDVTLNRFPDGWLIVTANWGTKSTYKESYRVKYVTGGAFLLAHEMGSVFVDFPELQQEKKRVGIEVGIYRPDGKKLGYRYQFYKNLKYGISVYFSPDDWDFAKGTRELYHRRFKK